MLRRRPLMLAAAAFPWVARAAEQRMPAEIRMIVPFAAGGATDLLARRLQPILDRGGHRLVVENLTGGGAVVGMSKLASARPDGTTLGLASSGLIAQMATGEVPLRPEQFAALVRVAEDPAILVTGARSPLRTLDDAIAALKARRGGVSIGSAGAQGTMGHLRLTAMTRELGTDFVYVGYPGAARLTNELLGGHVEMGLVKPNDVFGQVRNGEVRVLAVFDERRLPQLPEVPTIAEAGLAVHPFGRMIQMTYVAAPAGLPPALREAAIALFREAVLSPEFQAKAQEDCYIADALSGPALEQVLAETMEAFKAAQAKLPWS